MREMNINGSRRGGSTEMKSPIARCAVAYDSVNHFTECVRVCINEEDGSKEMTFQS